MDMTTDDALEAVLDQLQQVPILFYPLHIQLTGRPATAILLAYILRQVRWNEKHNNRKDYFRTDTEINEDILLTEKVIRRSKEDLKALPFMQIIRSGPQGRTHYSIDWPAYVEAVRATTLQNPVCLKGRNRTSSPKRAERDCLKGRNSYKENTEKKKHSRRVATGTLLPTANGEDQSSTPQVSTPPNSGRFQRTFEKLYERKYSRLYPFAGAKDGAAFKKLFSIFKQDRAEFKRAVIRYLANEEPFHHGHPITKMLLNVQQFMVAHPDDDEGTYTVSTPREISAEEEARFIDNPPEYWKA